MRIHSMGNRYSHIFQFFLTKQEKEKEDGKFSIFSLTVLIAK